MIEVTALQYVQILSNLPNPMRYYAEFGRTQPMRISVAYLEQPLNNDPIHLTLPNSPSLQLVHANYLEFELVPNNNLWFWQPTQEVKIVRVEKNQPRQNY